MKRIMLMSATLVVLAASTTRGAIEPIVLWHDPWLNWDFINVTGVPVDDLEIVVDSPNFNPNWLDPAQVNMGPWTQFVVTHADYDGDLDMDTKMTWSGAVIPPDPPNNIAHGGLFMKNSGLVLDAYWTVGGAKQGLSTAITYEKTQVIYDPDPSGPAEIHMALTIAPGWYEDHPGATAMAGWTHIRTFVNIPADLLGLAELNRTELGDPLGLNWLAAQPGVLEVIPKRPDGTDILYSDTIWGVPDSFFDVFLAEVPPEFAGPGFEALLHAEVVTETSPLTVIGEFWNLNPQSPEPATLSLLALGGLGLLLRRKR
jgi:hypothetical protein